MNNSVSLVFKYFALRAARCELGKIRPPNPTTWPRTSRMGTRPVPENGRTSRSRECSSKSSRPWRGIQRSRRVAGLAEQPVAGRRSEAELKPPDRFARQLPLGQDNCRASSANGKSSKHVIAFGRPFQDGEHLRRWPLLSPPPRLSVIPARRASDSKASRKPTFSKSCTN